MTPCPTCGGIVEPMTLTDELPGGRAESGECKECFTLSGEGPHGLPGLHAPGHVFPGSPPVDARRSSHETDAIAWATEDQRRHEAIERRASAWRAGRVGLFVVTR